MAETAKTAITITLTNAQIARVVREAAGTAGFPDLSVSPKDPQHVWNAFAPLLNNERLSQTLLRGLMVLVAFPSDGNTQSLADIARQSGLTRSTAHRYVTTWTGVGLLDQDPVTRRYKRAER